MQFNSSYHAVQACIVTQSVWKIGALIFSNTHFFMLDTYVQRIIREKKYQLEMAT